MVDKNKIIRILKKTSQFLPFGAYQVTIYPTRTPFVNNCDGLGPFCWLTRTTDPAAGFRAFATGVSNLIGLLTILAGLWFGFQLIIGAFSWMSSGGDKNSLEGARNRMIHAFTGLLIVVAAIAIIGVFGKFLGLDILINPSKLVCQLNPARDPATICQ